MSLDQVDVPSAVDIDLFADGDVEKEFNLDLSSCNNLPMPPADQVADLNDGQNPVTSPVPGGSSDPNLNSQDLQNGRSPEGWSTSSSMQSPRSAKTEGVTQQDLSSQISQIPVVVKDLAPPLSKHKLQVCLGNLTWWTTETDITQALKDIGVDDMVDIFFFENRANGQSKGFCIVTVGSELSIKTIYEKLSGRGILGQCPIVAPATQQSVAQFEAMAESRPCPSNFNNNGYGVNKGPYKMNGNGNVCSGYGPSRYGNNLNSVPNQGFLGKSDLDYGYGHGQGPRGNYHGHGFQRNSYGPPPALMHFGAPVPRMPRGPGMSEPRIQQSVWVKFPPVPPGSEISTYDHTSASGGPSHYRPNPHLNPAFFKNPRLLNPTRSFGSDAISESQLPQTGVFYGRSSSDSISPEPPAPAVGNPAKSKSSADNESLMSRYTALYSAAISRAVKLASKSEATHAMQTLQAAIDILKKSDIEDDRFEVWVTSLEDAKEGISLKLASLERTTERHESRKRAQSQSPDHGRSSHSHSHRQRDRSSEIDSKNHRRHSNSSDSEGRERSRYDRFDDRRSSNRSREYDRSERNYRGSDDGRSNRSSTDSIVDRSYTYDQRSERDRDRDRGALKR